MGPGTGRRRALPISLRVTLAFTALLMASLAIVGTVAYLQLGRELRHSLDSAILSATDDIHRRLPDATSADERVAAEVASTEVESQVLDRRGRIMSGSTPELAAQPLLSAEQFRTIRGGAPLFADSDRAEEPMRVHAYRVDDVPGVAAVVLAAELDPVSDARQAYLSLVFPLAVLAAALAAVSGGLIARRALRPVAMMTREAADIGSGDLSRRLAVSPTQDELSRLGTTLNEMLQRVHDAVRREREFTADASHELRTPLAVLRAELEVALDRIDDAQARYSVASAVEECDRLRGLTEDLLLIARAESTRLDTHAPLDLGDVTDTVLERLAPVADRSGVTLTREGDAVINGDPRALARALSNLVENALRHVGHGGRIAVLIEPDDAARTVRWSVSDDGPGIPPEDRERVVQRFARGGPGHAGGAGLGLAIVSAVVRSHGGTMSLGTSPAGGLLVTLTLPST